jgi:hypothetical protein
MLARLCKKNKNVPVAKRPRLRAQSAFSDRHESQQWLAIFSRQPVAFIIGLKLFRTWKFSTKFFGEIFRCLFGETFPDMKFFDEIFDQNFPDMPDLCETWIKVFISLIRLFIKFHFWLWIKWETAPWRLQTRWPGMFRINRSKRKKYPMLSSTVDNILLITASLSE